MRFHPRIDAINRVYKATATHKALQINDYHHRDAARHVSTYNKSHFEPRNKSNCTPTGIKYDYLSTTTPYRA